MQRAVKVKPLKHYLLLVKFDNDEVRVFNCFPLLQEKLFSKIADDSYFKTVHIDEMGLVCWDNATDINPYELYEKSEKITNFNFEQPENDPDFVKVTAAEKERLERIEAEMSSGEYYTDEEVWN